MVGLKDFRHDTYNPNLFAQLKLYRSDLNRDYFALVDALENIQLLKTRYLFVQFNQTLLGYLNKNRVELYGYLEKIHKNDDEKMIVIKANKAALITVNDVITNTLVKYISPSTKYNEKFQRELHTIWKILKRRYTREKKLLYPLYKNQRPRWLQHRSA